jgi:hypothetical protein
MAEYAVHSCDDHSHSHLSQTKIDELQDHGAIEWLRGSYIGKSQRELARLKAKSQENCVVKIRRFFSARGLSCSVGAELAEMLRDPSRRAIAVIMLAHIKMRIEEQADSIETHARAS